MPITINGTGTITGINAGGLPDGVITTDDIAAGAVTTAKITGGPAFSAYANATQTVSNATSTKVSLNAERWDTANAFDSTTNYRFQPTVAGYYQFNGVLRTTYSTVAVVYAELWKNGAVYVRGSENNTATTQVTVSEIIFLNGSTDYVEMYGLISGTGTLQFQYFDATFTSRLSGALIRPA